MSTQPEEPFIRWDGGDPTDDHGVERAAGFVLIGCEDLRLHGLGGEVAEEVDDQGRLPLREERAARLHSGVAAEGNFDGLDPGPVGAAEGWCFVWSGRRIAGGLRFGGFVAMLAGDVSLDGLVETAEAGPSSEECEGHCCGLRGYMNERRVRIL